MIRGAAAAASDPAAAQAASEALESGGSAADALVAGFAALAGAHASMLMAPVVGLVAGVGAGARVFDGRTLQPGRGIPRPRGFVEESDVPTASRVAVPRSIAAVYAMHARFGRLALRELFAGGVEVARKQGAAERAKLLRSIGDSGVLALRKAEVLGALLRVAGPVTGGLLTEQDVLEATPEECVAERKAIGEAGVLQHVPFGDVRGRPGHVVVAADARGTLAVLAATPTIESIAVEALELTLSLDAAPVRRGVPRVTPGTSRPAPSPIGVLDLSEGVRIALALVGRKDVEEMALLPVVEAQLVDNALRALAPLSAVVTDGREARAMSRTAAG